MTEPEALERISEIGQAFANDVNDGDDTVAYEGFVINHEPETGKYILKYGATLDNGSKVEFSWYLEES